MPGFMLAHGGDASGLGMLAFFPIALLLGIGILLVLRPTILGSGPAHTDSAEDDRAQDQEREEG